MIMSFKEGMSPVSKLIWEVSQQPVLYDSQNPMYKDNQERLKAWQHVAAKMKMPVTDCQIKWGTLRRCLANARKRQMRRQACGSKIIKKWRYQDEMSFLLPFIDQREYEYIGSKKKKMKTVDYEDHTDISRNDQDFYISEEYEASELDETQTEEKIRTEKLELYVVENTSNHDPLTADEMYIEEDEIEGYNADINRSFKRFDRKRNSYREQDAQNELLLDEMDSFFLSMSKALKKLPRVEQIQVRSQVYDLVTNAEMEWLQKLPNEPIENITS